jgi:hypothetical protein
MNVKSWLRRIPQPTKIRFDKKTLVNVGQGKNRWKDVFDAIITMQPNLVEALDSEGALIRATELASEEEAKETEEALTTEKQSDLAQLGKLLLDAYKAGASAHAESYKLAFEENTKLVTVLSNRLGGLEQAWQQTLEQRANELTDTGNGGGGDALGPLAPMLQGMAVKMMTQTAEASASAPRNGKGKVGK